MNIYPGLGEVGVPLERGGSGPLGKQCDLGKIQRLKFFYEEKNSSVSSKIRCGGIFSSKILTNVNDEQGLRY